MEKTRTIKIDKYSTWDLFFGIWFVTEFCSYHSIINTLATFMFLAVSFIFILRGRTHFNHVIPWISLFVLICYLNVLLGHSLSPSNSYAMIISLLKDLLFLAALVGYVRGVGVERFKSNFVVSTFVSIFVLILISVVATGSIIVRGANSMFNANYLAVCGAITSMIIISNDNYTISRRLWLVMSLAFFGILAGTRKAILALVVGIVVYFCAKYPKRLLRNTILFTLIFVLIYIALMRIPYLYNTIGYRFVTALDFFHGESGDSSIYMRSYYIQKGINEFKKSPVIGWGINCFKTLPGTMETYSHNNYVELLFSVGLIGTIEFYCIHFISLFNVIKKRNMIEQADFCLCLAVLFIVLFVDYSMVSYYERGSLIYIVLFYMISTQPYNLVSESCDIPSLHTQ